MARPTKYTKALVTSICEQIAHGAGLKCICSHPNMPCMKTVFNWLANEEHAEFLHMYERAREQQQEYWADEIIEIADDKANKGDVNRSRLMVDTRKWLMSKLAPRKYGENKRLEADVTHHVKRIILEDGGK